MSEYNFPIFFRHRSGAISKLAAPHISLSFLNTTEIELKTQKLADGEFTDAFNEWLMQNGKEITETEFAEKFSAVIQRLLDAQ